MRSTKTKTLVECALMIALATILGYIPIFELPQGGSITACSMMPLVVASFRHGPKWGLFTGFIVSYVFKIRQININNALKRFQRFHTFIAAAIIYHGNRALPF